MGIFLFLRLGFPHDAETTGYVSGLLVVAAAQVGALEWIVRGAVKPRPLGRGYKAPFKGAAFSTAQCIPSRCGLVHHHN